MAYVASQLDQSNTLQPSSTNIFQSFQNPMLNQGAPAQGGTPTKNTGGGTVGAGVGTGNTTPGAGSSTGQNALQAPVDQSQALQKQAVGSSPSFLGQVQQNQTNLQQQLNQEQSAYNQANTYNPTITQSQIADAAQGGADYTTVLNRLNQTQAPQAQTFQSTVNLNNPAEQALQSPQMLQQYLKTQGGAGYTQGMGGLDQILLSNNPQFQQQQQQILQTQQALQQQQATEAANLQNQAQQGMNTAYGNEGDAIKAALQSQQTDLTNQLNQAVTAGNAANTANAQGYISQEQQQALQQAIAGNPNLTSYLQQLNLGNVSTQPYYTAAAQEGFGNVANAQQQTQFNNLNTLLGLGYAPINTLSGATNPNFDVGGYRNALIQAAQALVPPQAPAPLPAVTNKQILPTTAGGAVTDVNNAVGKALSNNPSVQQEIESTMPVQGTPSGGVNFSAGPGMGGVTFNGWMPYSQTPFPVPNLSVQAPSAPKTPSLPIAPSPVAQKVTSFGKKVFSDINAKTNITQPSSSQVSNMFSKLTPYTYNYKPGLGLPPGPQMGVMAQDLQKSPLGAQAVSTAPGGLKQVDYTKLFPAMTAALANHDERIRAIEAQKKKRGY